MNQSFDHAIDLAAFAAQFLGPVAERDIPIRAMMLLQEAQVPSTDFAIHDGRVYLTAKGLTYLNLAAPKAPLPQPHPQLMVNTGGGGSLSRGASPLHSPNGTGSGGGSGYLSSDDAQRSLQRKRSISTLRKATLERQKQTTLERSPTSGLSPTTPTQQSSGSEPPKFGGLPPGMLGPPQQQQNYAPNSEPFPAATGGGFTTAPTDVVQYMDTLTRTYRQSKDPQVLNAMLQSPEANRVADFLVTSRTGTLTRNQPAPSLTSAPPPTLVMDPYCQSVYQWLCKLTSTPADPYPSLAAALRSGDILFDLAQHHLSKPPPSNFFPHDTAYSIHKIIYFFDCCRLVGMPDSATFPLTDLMADDGDPRALLRTLLQFDSAARKKSGFMGGKWPGMPKPQPGYFDGPWAAPMQVNPHMEVVQPQMGRLTYLPAETGGRAGGATDTWVAPKQGNPHMEVVQPQMGRFTYLPAETGGRGGGATDTYYEDAAADPRAQAGSLPLSVRAGGDSRSGSGANSPTHAAAVPPRLFGAGGANQDGNRSRLGSDASVGGFAPHEHSSSYRAAAAAPAAAASSTPPSSASAASASASALSKQTALLQSLLDQEELFLQDLQVVVDWMAIMETNSGGMSANGTPILTASERETLFGNTCALRDLHAALAPAMHAAVRSHPGAPAAAAEGLAVAVLSHVSELLREYELHALNAASVTALVETRTSRPMLHHMMRDFVLWPKAHGLSLESYLVRPGSHLSVYARKLDELISVGADGANVRRANDVVRGMISGIELKRLEANNNQPPRVPSYLVPIVVDADEPSSEDVGHGTATLRRNLHQAVDIATLESATRRFICQGSVWEVVHAGEVKVRSLLLFHDALILAKEQPPNKFEVRTILDLRTVTIRPTRDRARAALRLRPVVAKAVAQFNADPARAVGDLINKKVLDNSANNIASFLHKTPNLSRRHVGKFIGHVDNEPVAYAYAEWYSPVFGHLPFEDALRLYLSSLRLGNDGPAIDRVLTAFARTYAKVNPQRFTEDNASVDLVFATVLLNADMHGPTTLDGAPSPLALRDFINGHPGVAAGQMQAIYQSIQGEKLAMASDRSHRVSVDVLAIPTHLTLNEPSEWLKISIPAPDPNVTLRFISASSIKIEPPVLAFATSNSGYVRITGTQVGRHRMYFLLGGSTAAHYDYVLPLTVIVEPGYMAHTFSVEFPRANLPPPGQGSGDEPRRSTLTFSVASDEQRQRWVNYLTNAVEQLKYSAGTARG